MLPFLLLVIFGVEQRVSAGPPSESLARSFCFFYEFELRVFDRILSQEELLRSVKSYRNGTDGLLIMDSSFLFFPATVFEGTGLKTVIITRTEVISLSDGDVAFEGLEDTLTVFRACNVAYGSQWDWQQLRNLRNLRTLSVFNAPMMNVWEPFPALPSLEKLVLLCNEISFLVDGAFGSLTSLQVLRLKCNNISEMKRNMLPDPALRLYFLDLSENQLSFLPADFFTNMPSLQNVYLDNNKFTTMSEDTFSWALQKLKKLTMLGNPLICDCGLRWIYLKFPQFPTYLQALCSTPKAMAGRPLQGVNEKELWCLKET